MGNGCIRGASVQEVEKLSKQINDLKVSHSYKISQLENEVTLLKEQIWLSSPAAAEAKARKQQQQQQQQQQQSSSSSSSSSAPSQQPEIQSSIPLAPSIPSNSSSSSSANSSVPSIIHQEQPQVLESLHPSPALKLEPDQKTGHPPSPDADFSLFKVNDGARRLDAVLTRKKLENCVLSNDIQQMENLFLEYEQSVRSVLNDTLNDGSTLLTKSVDLNRVECLRLLLSFGANPQVPDTQGMLAAQLAVRDSRKECLAVLSDHARRRVGYPASNH